MCLERSGEMPGGFGGSTICYQMGVYGIVVLRSANIRTHTFNNQSSQRTVGRAIRSGALTSANDNRTHIASIKTDISHIIMNSAQPTITHTHTHSARSHHNHNQWRIIAVGRTCGRNFLSIYVCMHILYVYLWIFTIHTPSPRLVHTFKCDDLRSITTL